MSECAETGVLFGIVDPDCVKIRTKQDSISAPEMCFEIRESQDNVCADLVLNKMINQTCHECFNLGVT